jgi:hypothetical protein
MSINKNQSTRSNKNSSTQGRGKKSDKQRSVSTSSEANALPPRKNTIASQRNVAPVRTSVLAPQGRSEDLAGNDNALSRKTAAAEVSFARRAMELLWKLHYERAASPWLAELAPLMKAVDEDKRFLTGSIGPPSDLVPRLMKDLDHIGKVATEAWNVFARAQRTPEAKRTPELRKKVSDALHAQLTRLCDLLRKRTRYKTTAEASQVDWKWRVAHTGGQLVTLMAALHTTREAIDGRLQQYNDAIAAASGKTGSRKTHNARVATLFQISETLAAYVEIPSARHSLYITDHPKGAEEDLTIRESYLEAARLAVFLACARDKRVTIKDAVPGDMRKYLDDELPPSRDLDERGVEAFVLGLYETDFALARKTAPLSELRQRESKLRQRDSNLTRGDARRVVADLQRIASTYGELEHWYRCTLARAGMKATPGDPVLQELAARIHHTQLVIKGSTWFSENHLPEGEAVEEAPTAADEPELAQWIEEHLEPETPPTSSDATLDSEVAPAPPTPASGEKLDKRLPPVAAQVPAPAAPTQEERLDELRREEDLGDAAWNALSQQIGDIPMAGYLAKARRHYVAASKVIRALEKENEQASVLLGDFPKRIACKVKAMGELQQDRNLSLKIWTPTHNAITTLRSIKGALTPAWPGDMSPVQPGSRGWLVEVELKHAAVRGCQPPSWYLHMHLREGVDPTKPDWRLKAEDVVKAHVKIKGSRMIGELRKEEAEAAGVKSVSRCHLDDFQDVLDWIDRLGTPRPWPGVV